MPQGTYKCSRDLNHYRNTISKHKTTVPDMTISLLKWGIGTVPRPAIHVRHGPKIVYESNDFLDDTPPTYKLVYNHN